VQKTHSAVTATAEPTYQSQHLRRANPMEAYPTAVPFSVKCEKCSSIVQILPHLQLEEMVDRGTHHHEFYAFMCKRCNHALPLSYLANCMTNYCRQMVRTFYRCGATEEKEAEIRNQSAFLVSLFKEPKHESKGAGEKDKAQRSAKILDAYNNSFRYLSFSSMKETSRNGILNLPTEDRSAFVDPLEDQARRLYKAMDRNWVNPSQVFIGMGAVPEREASAAAASED
jgi:hypothetical protein